jgi:hypothetical protein
VPADPDHVPLSYPYEILDRSLGGDGHQKILKVELEGGPVVVKLYGRKQGVLQAILRDIGSRAIGKTSLRQRTRCATERAVLQLWSEHDLGVPELLPNRFQELDPQPYLVLEFIDGPSIWNILNDGDWSFEKEADLLRRFAIEWARRHELARQQREPRFIQLRAGLHHILVSGERQAAFDFEMCYTRRHPIDRLISLEILGYLRTLQAATGDNFERYLECVVQSYGNPAPFRRVREDAASGVAPWLKPLSRWQMRIRRRKATSKLRVLDSLERVLPR